jgi:hypothetical protein
MAATPAARQLTESHRVAQARLNALTVAAVRPLWRLLDPDNLAGTQRTWVDAVLAIVTARYGVSAALARRYLRSYRITETGQPFGSDLDRPALNVEAAATSLYVTGPVRIERARRRGADVGGAIRIAEASSAAAAGRHALTGGRTTITRTVETDRHAVGWARATSGNPCAFCALIAGRGPVFSEESAAFEAHDGCACTAEPVYSRTAPFPGGRYAEMYREAAQDADDPLNSFRRAYEGRV